MSSSTASAGADATSSIQPPPPLKPIQKKESVVQRLVSASFGAAATVLFTSPMDVVKVRQQSASSNVRLAAAQLEEQLNAERMDNPLIRCPACGVAGPTNRPGGQAAACLHPNHQHHHHHTAAAGAVTSSSASSASPVSRVAKLSSITPPLKTSAFATLSNVVKTEGVGALWSGLKPGLIMSLPSTTLYFACYEELREYFDAKWRAHKASKDAALGENEVSTVAPMAAGIISRVFTVGVVSPLELMRTKELYRRSGRPLIAALVDEVRGSGSILSLWRGFGATVWRDVPFSGVYWFTYENVKTLLTKRRMKTLAAEAAAEKGGAHSHSPAPQLGFLDTFGISFGSGVAAGGLSAFITTPWDVIKTRTQVAGLPGQPAMTAGHAHGQLPSGTAAALLHIARNEGLTGLFAGVSARVGKVAPACAIMIGSYELGKKIFASFVSSDGEAAVTASSVTSLAAKAVEDKKTKNDEAHA
jgi:solute carrier family 25, member 39/40